VLKFELHFVNMFVNFFTLAIFRPCFRCVCWRYWNKAWFSVSGQWLPVSEECAHSKRKPSMQECRSKCFCQGYCVL